MEAPWGERKAASGGGAPREHIELPGGGGRTPQDLRFLLGGGDLTPQKLRELLGGGHQFAAFIAHLARRINASTPKCELQMHKPKSACANSRPRDG